jgi:hypothetical protein
MLTNSKNSKISRKSHLYVTFNETAGIFHISRTFDRQIAYFNKNHPLQAFYNEILNNDPFWHKLLKIAKEGF